MDLISMKCHDIRHQAQLLRENPAVRIDEAALLEMEEAANIYDSYARSGNEAMDTILTEKGVFCQSNGIPFNYIVDGGSLSALSTSDLCLLFGNILENAIEAELQQPVDKRLITLKVFRNRDYVCIHAENYCETLPEMKDDVPQNIQSRQKPAWIWHEKHPLYYRKVRRTRFLYRQGPPVHCKHRDSSISLVLLRSLVASHTFST